AQAVHFGECSKKLLGNAIAEIGVVFSSTQIVERQNGDRLLQWAGRSDDFDPVLRCAIGSAHDPVSSEIEKPGEHKRRGKTEHNQHDGETDHPNGNVEYWKNLGDALSQRPATYNIRNRDAINSSPLQLRKKVFQLHGSILPESSFNVLHAWQSRSIMFYRIAGRNSVASPTARASW